MIEGKTPFLSRAEPAVDEYCRPKKKKCPHCSCDHENCTGLGVVRVSLSPEGACEKWDVPSNMKVAGGEEGGE